MHFLSTMALAAVLPFITSAHMMLAEPIPIFSQHDPAVPDNLKDYSYTSPLSADGSDFPCKGYHLHESSYVSKATYKAGQSGTMTLKPPGATHNGGSCQISLSYDNGNTWKVIESMEHGCPLEQSYGFQIPKDAPSSDKVLFAWSWFNLVGNREMYMNCARVTIEGNAPGRHRRAQLASRQDPLSYLPDMYTCNIGRGCTTTENQDVVFPQRAQDSVEAEPVASDDSGESAASAPASPSSATSSSATPSQASPPFANDTVSPSPTGPTSAPTATNVVVPVPAAQSSAAPAAPTPAAPASASGSCTDGSIVCDSTTTFSMCAGGALVSMGSVAEGTTCVDGNIA